jgi:hypothetical protein
MVLRDLGDRSSDFAQQAAALLPNEKNNWIGITALLNLRGHGSTLLADWLKNQVEIDKHQYDVAAIRALYNNVETRKVAIDLAVSRSRRPSAILDALYDIADEGNDVGVREQILDKAVAARAFVVTEPLCAIEGLAKFDSARAIEAIELGLRNIPAIERCVLVTPGECGAAAIGTGKDVQHQRRIGDRAGRQPEVNEVIEAVGHLAVWDQAERRLQADDAGTGSRQARAGPGIGCQRERP